MTDIDDSEALAAASRAWHSDVGPTTVDQVALGRACHAYASNLRQQLAEATAKLGRLEKAARHNAFGDSHTDYFAQQEMLAQKALEKHPGGVEKAPKPGDVVDGATAKAYMLANPGRRVMNTDHPTTYWWDAAVHKWAAVATEWRNWQATDFDTGDYKNQTYRVLPPEPTEPAKPGEVERIERLERALRALIEPDEGTSVRGGSFSRLCGAGLQVKGIRTHD